ncbi:hypothetical protein Pelo_17493 [Pelomyxa schiedti]|nr:hypothetical protein Pelo_17493 [Pelomyxa schiedti]
MKEVCSKGHLEVFKWILCNLFHINEGNKVMLRDYLIQSAEKGHLHILKWLVDTFALESVAESITYGLPIYFRAKNSIYDLKRFSETFPHWEYSDSSVVLDSVGLSKSSTAEETIEVCQWIKDFFHWGGGAIALGKNIRHAEVMRWALSDVTDEDSLAEAFSLSCVRFGDVELGKWFVEEKGITPNAYDFTAACSGKHDNTVFVEWLSKHVSLAATELLESLHRALARQHGSISTWLEKRLLEITNTKPRLSLQELVCNCRTRHFHENWLQWVMSHSSSSCNLDCSETELINTVKSNIERRSMFRLHIAISIWTKFTLPPQVHHHLLVKMLIVALRCGTFHQVQQVASLGSFSAYDIGQCLSAIFFPLMTDCPQSKSIKWLISEFIQRSRKQTAVKVRKPLHRMFAACIHMNKRGCAQWLFHRFHITLPEVLEEVNSDDYHFPLAGTVDLCTWKLILQLFPAIDKNVTMAHFMRIVAASPLHGWFTINKLGVTLDEILRFCSRGYAYTSDWWIFSHTLTSSNKKKHKKKGKRNPPMRHYTFFSFLAKIGF